MIRNFLFHRVHPQRDPLWDPMDLALFDKCIQYIAKKYEVVLFEDLAKDKSALSKKNKFATIMFDDGYKDNFEYALPILEKYKVKASFYVVTDCIDKNVPTWTHVLEHSFQATQIKNLELPFDILPKELQSKSFLNDEDKLKFAAQLKPFLKTIPHQKREEILLSIEKQFNDVEPPKLMMNWEEVRALKERGHYIGSHSVTHSMLGTMEHEGDIEKELQESGNRIKEELGYFPTTISYPIGSFDERIKKLSKKVGYSIGLAVKQDTFNPNTEDLLKSLELNYIMKPGGKQNLEFQTN
ncbi:polysaccharide deacetylase family protein [Brumimicrobium aurantiacum]|uniref:Polysaccharide deacetylase family protein n=1 Tax=Brumimicrobium aurantiacum TaxID=1737063 RepID=A0A3E1F1N1_9FLAO|nr:polysaccharide deacetylase family protein [Brumimicrobium aurantiacum]RFC55732.1 polysaccharide deacetylase family protein [Brumimicrobium aurantiacum]